MKVDSLVVPGFFLGTEDPLGYIVSLHLSEKVFFILFEMNQRSKVQFCSLKSL